MISDNDKNNIHGNMLWSPTGKPRPFSPTIWKWLKKKTYVWRHVAASRRQSVMILGACLSLTTWGVYHFHGSFHLEIHGIFSIFHWWFQYQLSWDLMIYSWFMGIFHRMVHTFTTNCFRVVLVNDFRRYVFIFNLTLKWHWFKAWVCWKTIEWGNSAASRS